MEWGKESALFIIEIFKNIFRGKRPVISHDVRYTLDGIISVTAPHRLIISKATNGGGSLKKEDEMYYSVLYCYNDERFIKKLPEINNLKADVHLRYIIRRVLEEKKVVIRLGELPPDSILYDGMKKYGSNITEYYLLRSRKREAMFLILTTNDIEINPFDEYRMELELQISRLKKYFK